MVRVKEKARKGDEAFVKRRQKVGRKKLAPATATRAEVHARTLRVTTPMAITRGALEVEAAGAGNGDGRYGCTSGQYVVSAEQMQRDFKEHLVNTGHYKKSVRANAFVSLTRTITAAFPATKRKKHNVVDGSDEQLSPLLVLCAYTNALEAMTDTEDDVRNAALGLLKVILHQWHSTKHLEGVNTTCDGVHSAMNSVVDTFDLDRSRAALQIVDVALTHAMMSVRRSGVELLELFLQVQPWGVQAVLSKSTDWVKMARRMSSIVLPSTSSGGSTSLMKMLHVVAKFLETMMPYEGDETEKWDADCMNLQHVTDERMCREKDEQGTSVLVAHFFEECAPRWAVAWKELMELRGSLFRDAEFVRRAAAIARSFACCAMYLQKHQLLTKNHLQLMHQLFVAKVPFTMHELVNNHREVECECSTSERSNRRRVELGNAIADACLPLAPSDNDALKVLRNFLSNSIDGLKGQCGMDGNHPNRAGSPRALHHIGPVRTLRTAMVRLSHRLLPRLASLVSPLLQVVTRTCSAGEEDAADRTLLVSVLMMSADIFASLVQSREVVQSSEGVAYVRSAVLAVPRMLFALRDLDVDSARLDRIVFSFLQPIWHVVSCGHPMLTTSVPSECVGKGERDEHTAQQQLAVSLTSLFEIHVPDEPNKGMCRSIEGVLRRCGDRTVELAVHTLFYVGGTVPRTSWARGDSILSFPVLIDTLPRPGYYASPSPDVATRAKST